MVLNIYPDMKLNCFGGIVDEKMLIDFDHNNNHAVSNKGGSFSSS